MTSFTCRLILALTLLATWHLPSTAAPFAPDATVLFAAKDDPWYKSTLNWIDEYASSKTGMIQIGVLAVLLSLYIITRKDGPK